MRLALQKVWWALPLGLVLALSLPGCPSSPTTGGTPSATDKEPEKDKDKEPGKPPPKDPG